MDALRILMDRLGISGEATAAMQTAVTHGSINQVVRPHVASYEALATVGDSVLDLLSAERHYHAPDATNDSITIARRREVSRKNLGRLARSIHLADALVLGPGGENQRLRHDTDILAESLEAIFAAVFFDQGLDAARSLYERLFPVNK